MGDVQLQVTSVTITAPDPLALAAFYARLLDRPVTAEAGPRPGDSPTAGWAQIRSTDGGRGPTLNFESEDITLDAAYWNAPSTATTLRVDRHEHRRPRPPGSGWPTRSRPG